MGKIEITKTELVWPGKYNEDGTLKEVPRVNLPFQVIETINESRATREGKKGKSLSWLFHKYNNVLLLANLVDLWHSGNHGGYPCRAKAHIV